MIMSFFTFCLNFSQLFSKGMFTGLNSVWRLLTCHSYGVRGLYLSIKKSYNQTKTSNMYRVLNECLSIYNIF